MSEKKNFNQIQLYYLTICPLSAVKTPRSGFMKFILFQKLCKYKKIKWEIYRFAKKLKVIDNRSLKQVYNFSDVLSVLPDCVFCSRCMYLTSPMLQDSIDHFLQMSTMCSVFLSWLREAQFSISRMLIMVYLKPVPTLNYR